MKAKKSTAFLIWRHRIGRHRSTQLVGNLGWLTCILLIWLVAIAPASAQTANGALQGTVTDEQKAVVPGVTVTVTNVERGWTRTATTDERGWYRVAALPPGDYKLQVELSGFDTVVRSGLTLAVAQEATIDLTLKTATIRETLTVTGAAPLVEPTRSDIGTTITGKELDSLPLASRDYTSLATTAPGVTGVGGGGINAGGQLSRNDSYYIDGTKADNDIVSGPRGTYSLETVREFIVLANQFAAEYGQASGAVVAVVTRSGTNQVHGRAFVFDRDAALDSEDYFAQAQGSGKAPYSQLRFGAFVGGPIVKDRLHYFGAYEYLRRRQTSVVTSPLVPLDQRNFPHKTDEQWPFIRADWQLPRSNALVVRYRRDLTKEEGVFIGGYNTYSRGTNSPYRYSDLHASETGVLSERMLNEVRFQRAYRYLAWKDTYAPYGTPDIRYPSGNFGVAQNAGGDVLEDRWEVGDTFSYSRGRHDFKTGGAVSVIRGADGYTPNRFGTFYFNTDAPFNPSDNSTYPYLFTQTKATPPTQDNTELYSFFVQDTWRVRPNLTLNLGVRYDTDTAVSTATKFPNGVLPGRVPPSPVANDRDNIAPRLGFVWDPFHDGRTAVRGGFGLYYSPPFMNYTGDIQYAWQAQDVTIGNPGYPDPYSRGTAVVSRASVEVIQPGFQWAYTRSISLGVKREVVPGLAVSVDVVNSRGYNQVTSLDINWAGPGVPRPDPNYLRIMQFASIGNSWFSALLLGLERRAGPGPTFGVSYTLSRAQRETEDPYFTPTGPSAPQDPLNPAAEKALANNDRRHQVVAHITWALPGDFQVAAFAQARSGLPWTVTTGVDNLGDAIVNIRPDVAVPGGDPLSKNTYFAGFTGRVGNLGRNSNIGPAFFELDVRGSKFISLRQRKVEAFVEAFNLTNRANFGSPVGNLLSSQFGQSVNLAGGARQVEIGFRFNF